MSNRKKYSPEFKAKVALYYFSSRFGFASELKSKILVIPIPIFRWVLVLSAIKGEKTIAELSSYFQAHPIIIAKWKIALVKNASNAFDSKKYNNNGQDSNTRSLNAKIGKLLMERDFLKKTLKMF